MASHRGWSFLAIVAGVVAVDQSSKAVIRDRMAVGDSLPIIDGALWLTHVENTGAAFGMLRGQQWLLIATAVLMLAVVAYVMTRIRPADPWVRASLALVTGGALGNLIDRSIAGAVTDFFDLGWFPVFNVADIALDVGVAIIVMVLLFRGEHALAGHHVHRPAAASADTHDEEVLAADVQPEDA